MSAPRTITVAGLPVRIYPAPGPGRQFPWVSFDDLLIAADFLPESIAVWAQLWRAEHPDRSHTLAGQLLVPSESALGLFEAARLSGWERAELALRDYQAGSGQFFVDMNKHLHGDAFRAAVHEAILRASVVEGVH